MNKIIFKVGDTVYCKLYGQGVVEAINVGNTYPIIVDFLSGESDIYTFDGRIYGEFTTQCLSFTPWTEQPNLERPIDYTDWIGKVCAFWNGNNDGIRVDRLMDYHEGRDYKFKCEVGSCFKYCKLIEDQELINKIKQS